MLYCSNSVALTGLFIISMTTCRHPLFGGDIFKLKIEQLESIIVRQIIKVCHSIFDNLIGRHIFQYIV